MTHTPASCDLLVNPLDGISELLANPTPEQVEVLGILGWGSCVHGHIRLTRREEQTLADLIAWRHQLVAVP